MPGSAPPHNEADDLFAPTLQHRTPELGLILSSQRPWRIPSQLWVAFFGGALASTAIAWLNASRLNLPARARARILLLGLVASAASVSLAVLLVPYLEDPSGGSLRGAIRLSSRLIALLLYLVFARIQKPADRIFVSRGGEHASLWLPGLAAVGGLGVLQGFLTWAIASGVRAE